MFEDLDVPRPRIRPLTRTEYDRMVELGMFVDEPIELLRGALVYMSPQGSVHSWIVERLTELLVLQVVGKLIVKVQSPLALSDIDEPEPDLALVPHGNYLREHPSEALLVIEVSVTTLGYDLRAKSLIYALADVPELWVVDAKAGCVHVHTEPVLGVWTRVRQAVRGEILVPTLVPFVSVTVSDILPPG